MKLSPILKVIKRSLCLLSLSMASCSPQQGEVEVKTQDLGELVRLSESVQKVVYGDDSRLDYYQLSQEDIMSERVMHSTGLLVRPSLITIQGQRVLLGNETLGEAQNLCQDEQFVSQPEPGHCSGALIDSDLFLTAGHCIDNQEDCDNTRIVFRSLYTSPNELYPTTVQDLYSCAEIITRRNDGEGDYAVIRLDRQVSGGLEPAPVWSSVDPLPLGTPITLIGGPNGIPVKTDKQGRVTNSGSSSRITFGVSVDAFGGNSGSGLYSEDGQIVGILVQGRTDYYFDQQSGCRRVAQIDVNEEGIPIDNRGAETGTYVSRALATLCPLRPDALACGGEGSNGEAGGEMMGGEMMGGEMMGGEMMGGEMVGPIACADEQEEDDSQARAASAIRDQFMVYNYCDDSTDWVSFQVEEGERLDFETYSLAAEGSSSVNETDTVLSIHDLNGALLAEDDDGGSGRASRLLDWAAPSAGMYAAKIRSYGSVTGEDLNYRFMVRSACDDDAFELLNAYTASSDPRSQLQDDRPLIERYLNEETLFTVPLDQSRSLCDEDWIAFELIEGELINEPTVVIQTSVSATNADRADTILRLYGPNGQLIEENDDRSNNDRSSYISRQVTAEDAGVYWVQVSGYEGRYSGTKTYDIEIRFAETCDEVDNDNDGVIDEGLVNCLTCEPDLYEDNDTFDVAVGFGLGYLSEANHCLDATDYYRFNLQRNQAIDIETYVQRRSDTVARLYASDEELLVENDDRAQRELASLIENFVAPRSNTYRLNIQQFNNRVGPERPYQLLVREHCTADEYEHDDLATEARLLEMVPGELYQESGTLCDPDWRRVSLTDGQWLDLGLVGDETSPDRLIEVVLSSSFGARVLRTEVSTEGSIGFSFESPETGDYWLLTRPVDQYYGGDLSYQLSLTARELDRCDGVDNDQDGETDEGTLNACGGCGVLPIEVCNGEDEDCDGEVDEGTLNVCGECGELPIEVCNGEDEDCDGSVDEGTRNACGECGALPTEVCNGEDDDCDGEIDEGVLNACGECGGLPSQDLCDNQDNDCDGRVDEECEISGGETSGGETSGGETSGGEMSGGEMSGGEMSGGETSGGEMSGGEMSGGEMSGGETTGGETSGGETSGGEMSGGTNDEVTVIIGGQEGELDILEEDGGNQDNDDEGDRGGTSTSGCASATGDLHHMSGLIIVFWLSLGFIITRLRDREYL